MDALPSGGKDIPTCNPTEAVDLRTTGEDLVCCSERNVKDDNVPEPSDNPCSSQRDEYIIFFRSIMIIAILNKYGY